MDPVEPSSAEKLEMYDVFCIHIKNSYARIKVLMLQKDFDKCEEHWSSIKTLYLQILALNLDFENVTLKTRHQEIIFLVLDAFKLKPKWVRSGSLAGFDCLEPVSSHSESQGCQSVPSVSPHGDSELPSPSTSPFHLASPVPNPPQQIQASSSMVSAVEHSLAPPSGMASHVVPHPPQPIQASSPPVSAVEHSLGPPSCMVSHVVPHPLQPIQASSSTVSAVEHSLVSPSGMAAFGEPSPLEGPKETVVGSLSLCSPPPLMSLCPRIPPLMSLTVFPCFCISPDPSLSPIPSFKSNSSIASTVDSELSSHSTSPLACVSTVVSQHTQACQSSSPPVSAVEFSPAPPSSQDESSSLGCSPCSGFSPVMPPCSRPVNFAAPPSFGFLCQFVAAFLCNLSSLYRLFQTSAFCR